jgi:hypothetical protein
MYLSLNIPEIHSSRMNSLMVGVKNALDSNKLTLTALGRASKDKGQIKSKIKRMDRLIGNKDLHQEINNIYSVISSLIIGNKKHPIIIVDWANVDNRNKFEVLKATVAYEGRGLTILDRVEYKNRGTKAENNSHDQFIDDLEKIIPKNCQPIVVADAAFSAKWFRRIESKGWYWVGRLRGRIQMQRVNGEPWLSCDDLFSMATNTPQEFGEYIVSKKHAIKCTLFTYKKPARGRMMKNLDGSRKTDIVKSDHAKSAKEPWLLASNLPKTYNMAKKVINCYAKRMQIEETIRDNKSTNYGLGIRYTLSETKERISVLVLIATLALLIFGVLGKAAYEIGLYKQFQANTIKHRKVLSFWYLGRQIYEHMLDKINIEQFRHALLNMLEGVQTYDSL